MEAVTTEQKLTCYHCGEFCDDAEIIIGEKIFCCEGCKLVFELLSENNLCTYYQLNRHPGLKQLSSQQQKRFEYLDDSDIKQQLIIFSNSNQTHVIFNLPAMHCSSCIWLLEQLHQFNNGIIKSTVNFPLHQLTVVYDHKQVSMREVAELLTSLGYEPHISLEHTEQKKAPSFNRKYIYKIGVAGFCFGNIMMLSFPEYFGLGSNEEPALHTVFAYLNLILAIPTFLFSGSEFFSSAWKSLRKGILNIDAPIALAILVTFGRSAFEILSHTGAGYMDSMSGIIFFMLLGRYFQQKTYDRLSFDRDYHSYFPVATTRIIKGKEEQIPVAKLQPDDVLLIRNRELIPADSLLLDELATMDYSFVTGESDPVVAKRGDQLYAGVIVAGAGVHVRVIKKVSQSYLTGLWNNAISKKHEETSDQPDYIHRVSRYFAAATILIAVFAGLYWLWFDPSKAINSFSAVLIVACPCALLLSSTFTYGNVIRILGNNKYYVKNALIVDQLAKLNTIVLDKTGTMTLSNDSVVEYKGKLLDNQIELVSGLANQSLHPLSRRIATLAKPIPAGRIHFFKEITGEGIEAKIDGHHIKLGSATFVGSDELLNLTNETRTHLSIDGEYFGCFTFKNRYRNGLDKLINQLKSKYELFVLSGDNDSERKNLEQLFGSDQNLFFSKSPEHKFRFINKLRHDKRRVAMVGDGLNDAAAMQSANVGIAISDDTNNFNPACDVIAHGSNFSILNKILGFCRSARHIIILSFVISILYNLIGLWFATQGILSPVIAAILMPVSSISIVVITTMGSSVSAWLHKLN